MTGTWEVKSMLGGGWFVLRSIYNGRGGIYRLEHASRITSGGILRLLWPTREAAERAARRLNRKYTHECRGLYPCSTHGTPFVVRSRYKGDWIMSHRPQRFPTQAQAFASALAYATSTRPPR